MRRQARVAMTVATSSPTISSSRALQFKNCVLPPNAVTGAWYYELDLKAYTGCTTDHDTKPWIMLNAYRGGSDKRTHWRYADGATRELPCLKDWTYYGKDGVWIVAKVQGEWKTQGESKPWCALPRYRKNGKRGFQWDYCVCEFA